MTVASDSSPNSQPMHDNDDTTSSMQDITTTALAERQVPSQSQSESQSKSDNFDDAFEAALAAVLDEEDEREKHVPAAVTEVASK